MSSDTNPNPKSIQEIKKLIKENYLLPDSESETRRLMVEGFEFIENRIKYNSKLNLDISTDDMQSWVHKFVSDKLGGTIRGNKIVWEINNKIITLDPMTCEIC